MYELLFIRFGAMSPTHPFSVRCCVLVSLVHDWSSGSFSHLACFSRLLLPLHQSVLSSGLHRMMFQALLPSRAVDRACSFQSHVEQPSSTW